jgi:hypothetical protein
MARIKLSGEDIKRIRTLCYNTNLTDKEISVMYGVSRGHITKIKNNKRWNYDELR